MPPPAIIHTVLAWTSPVLYPFHKSKFLQKMHFSIHPLHGLSENSRDEDRYDRQWTYIADEEPQDAEQLGVAADVTSVCKLVVDISLLEAPAYEEDGQEAAESHEDVRREIVKEIENVSTVYLYMRQRSE